MYKTQQELNNSSTPTQISHIELAMYLLGKRDREEGLECRYSSKTYKKGYESGSIISLKSVEMRDRCLA